MKQNFSHRKPRPATTAKAELIIVDAYLKDTLIMYHPDKYQMFVPERELLSWDKVFIVDDTFTFDDVPQHIRILIRGKCIQKGIKIASVNFAFTHTDTLEKLTLLPFPPKRTWKILKNESIAV